MVARKLMALALLTGGFAIAIASTANAQEAQAVTTTLSCSGGPGEIRPLGPPGQWSCTATTEWSGGVTDSVTPATVQIQASNPQSWMNVIISPNAITMTPENNPQGGVASDEQQFQVSVSLTQNAPAFLSNQLQLQPSTSPNRGNFQNVNDNPTQLTVTPGYFNLYNVRLDQKIAEGGPDSSVTYPIILDNFSNGDTRFEFSLANADNVPSGYQPVIPEPLVIQSQATGGETTQGQATFQVFTPFTNGYVNRIASMQLIVDSFYAPDTNIEGASSQVSTLTKTRGFYVPGPGAPLAALGVLGAALGLAKARNRVEFE